MVCRFGAFELDEEARELRHGGRAIFLQPRIFNLLAYLVRNRGRVVSKEELLDALWPGVIVTDGSLQRAISLARRALRGDGATESIRTVHRQGYRFCVEVVEGADDRSGSPPAALVARARNDYERGAWDEATAGFQRADAEEGALQASDLERWAYALLCCGALAKAVGPLERAVAANAAAGDRRSAARAALYLSHIQFEQRNFAVAQGWRKQADAFLTEEARCHEHGLLKALESRAALGEGRLEDAARLGEEACALGRALADADVEAMGSIYRGHALLGMGAVEPALPLLDGAGAAVLAGRVAPLIGGIVYCGVIWGYRNLPDWDRASQWVENFTQWCSRSGLSTYSGSCGLHRAEVLAVRGELGEAEKAIREACRLLPATSARTEGEAYRILGDLRLAHGDLEGAEIAFRRAHELGFDPQPGYAMLQWARGNRDAAIRALERALDDQGWSNRQRRAILLGSLATVAALAGRLPIARSAVEALERGAGDIPALAVLRERAHAELALAQGRPREAIAYFQRTVELWREMGAPLNVAEARVRLADACFACGDLHAAELELSAAEAVSRALGVPCRSCEELRERWHAGSMPGPQRRRPTRGAK